MTVQVAAEDWHFCQRRIIFLEALVLHLSRDGLDIQEWFQAGELAAMRLPGLPASRSAIAQRAERANWHKRRIGRYVVYHLSSLPARAFDEIVARLIDLPIEIEPPAAPIREPATNTAPPWVLPLMRLMRGSARGDLSQAWRALPDNLPAGTTLPSADEAALVLVELGLSEKIANWSEH